MKELPPPNPDLIGYSVGDGSDGGWLKVAFDLACTAFVVLVIVLGVLTALDLPR